jgi:hypothetical protein
MKSNAIVQCNINEARDMVFMAAGNDESITLLVSRLIDLTPMRELALTALYHGFRQKVSDAAAIPCDKKTGKPATPKEKFDAMATIVRSLNDGNQWNTRVAAPKKSSAEIDAMIAELAAMKEMLRKHGLTV